MGINVSTSMGFENRETLRQTAKKILRKKDSDNSAAEKVVQKVFYDFYDDPTTGMTILKASKQPTFSDSLKDTINYLKVHANDRRKREYVLGDLWQTLSGKDDNYKGELIDFVVDYSSKNIFAA